MQSVIEEILLDISNKCNAVDDIYTGSDGLKYCSKCNTPAEKVVKLLGKEIVVNCLCRCRKEQADREEAEFKEKEKLIEIERNIQIGMKDRKYLNNTFDKSDTELAKEKAYCRQFDKMLKMDAGIMFNGSYGGGKTYRASCIANELLKQGYTVYMDNITSLCMEIHGKQNKQEFISSLADFDLLILDDIGAERKTEYMIELVYNIVDTRYRSCKPLIITTNLDIKDLVNVEDFRQKRTYDRLLEMCPYPITVESKARRKEIGNEKYKQLKGLLE